MATSMTFNEIEQQIKSLFDNINLLPKIDQVAAMALISGQLLILTDKLSFGH
jgi:hypothetical protein